MTMPIQFDTNHYVKILTDAGVPHDEAVAHATALRLALSQPVANDADLIIHRAELRAMLEEMGAALEARLEAKLTAKLGAMLEAMLEEKLEEKLRVKLRPLYAMGTAIVIMQSVTMAKLFL